MVDEKNPKTSRKPSSSKLRKKEKILKEYGKFKNKLVVAILSGIVSMFLVPVLIDHIQWDISLSFFGNVLELDSLVLYVILTLVIYVIFRVIYHFLMNRLKVKF